jgi:putative transposase
VLSGVDALPVAASANIFLRASSSARCWQDSDARPSYLVKGPVPRPKDWLASSHEAGSQAELEAMRHSVERGTPYGDERWLKATVARLGLESTLRPRGWPRKSAGQQ